MTKTKVCLGIDVGTQGCKVLAYDTETRQVVARGAASYKILPSDVPGRAEQHPNTWIEGVVTAVRQALVSLGPASAARVASIGVSGQQHGLVVLDDQFQVLRPCKLWCDVESAAEAEALSKELNCTIVPSFTISKLLWLKNHEPDTFEQVAYVMLPHDYVNWWLTGEHVTEAGDASGTGFLNLRTRQWEDSATELVDPRVRWWLPRIVDHDQVIGALLPRAAERLGLPPGASVSPGSGDNAMACLGAGVVTSGLVVSLGTSGTVFGPAPQPIEDATGGVCPFISATGAGLPLLCTLNCTLALQEVAAAFGLSHEELIRLAAQEPPGCHGVTFLPYLIGERTPNWPTATGTLHGLRPGLLRPGVLYRAAMEGATFSLLAGTRRMEGLGLPVPTEVRVVGGGAQNALWRQVIADAFQLPVRVPVEVESAALGAAVQAAACWQGVSVCDYVIQHPPALHAHVTVHDQATTAAYTTAFQRFQRLGATLYGGGTKLSGPAP